MVLLTHDDRLAFDTIGFCAFSYRFNEFYTDNVHPFARQMADVLTEAGKRTLRTAVENKLRFQSNQKYWSDIGEMHKLCQEVLDERVKNPKPEINDLLNVMLNTPDPVTGEKLDATNIKYQMATFLVSDQLYGGLITNKILARWPRDNKRHPFFPLPQPVDSPRNIPQGTARG